MTVKHTKGLLRHDICGRLYNGKTYGRICPHCYPDQARESMGVKAKDKVTQNSRNRFRDRPVPF